MWVILAASLISAIHFSLNLCWQGREGENITSNFVPREREGKLTVKVARAATTVCGFAFPRLHSNISVPCKSKKKGLPIKHVAFYLRRASSPPRCFYGQLAKGLCTSVYVTFLVEYSRQYVIILVTEQILEVNL